MSSDDHKSHVLMIFNLVTSYVEDVLKNYILNEILLVAISILKSSLRFVQASSKDILGQKNISGKLKLLASGPDDVDVV